jgi:hypothetical protein
MNQLGSYKVHMVIERNRRLSMLVSDDEWRMLQALADANGVTASDYVRQFIRREHDSKFAAKPKKKR